jgi:hypothetical protein
VEVIGHHRGHDNCRGLDDAPDQVLDQDQIVAERQVRAVLHGARADRHYQGGLRREPCLGFRPSHLLEHHTRPDRDRARRWLLVRRRQAQRARSDHHA